MNWHNPDAYPGESEEEYIARKNGESQSATGLMFVVGKVFIFALKILLFSECFFILDFYFHKSCWEQKPTNLKSWCLP